MKIEFLPVRTRVVKPPKDDIWDIIDRLKICDGDIIFITSKIISIHQGRTVKIGSKTKEELIRSEAERYLPYVNKAGNFHVNLTVTQGVLIASAGIDESNANGYYILWPKNIDQFCREVREYLMKKFNLNKLGVVVPDAHTTPLRWGVTGIAIGLAGVKPLKDIRGKEDLFGRPMHITQIDMIDPITAMAVNLMGEGNECTPIAILRGYKNIEFSNDASMQDFKINPENDLYQALIDVIPKVDNLDRVKRS